MQTTTNMKIEIDSDTADRIVVCSLRESITILEFNINELSKRKRLSNYDKITLKEQTEDLSALLKVLKYYGGDLK